MRNIQIPYGVVEIPPFFKDLGVSEVSRISREADYHVNSSEESIYHIPQGVTLQISIYREQERLLAKAFGDEEKIGEVERIITNIFGL